jgi:acyl carrier protein
MLVLFFQNLNDKIMSKDNRIEVLKEIIKPYVNDQIALDALQLESDFINDLKINSAHLVDVILDIEDKFDITIDTVSMEKMLTVGIALEIIEEKLSNK